VILFKKRDTATVTKARSWSQEKRV